MFRCCCPWSHEEDDEVNDPLLMPESHDHNSIQQVLQQALDSMIDMNIYTIASINRLGMYAKSGITMEEKEIKPPQYAIPEGQFLFPTEHLECAQAAEQFSELLAPYVNADVYIESLE